MFNRIFDPENFVFRGFGKALDVMVLSLLWVVLCIPVITMGPATTALYYTTVKCLRRGKQAPYVNFFRCFRENFKIGALAGLILAVCAAILLFEYNLLALTAANGDQGAVVGYYAFCVVASLLWGAACYLFPLLSRFTLPLGGLFVRAGQLALRHLPTTILLAVIHLAAAWAALQFWIYLLPALFLPVLTAFLSSLPLERVFRQYTQVSESEQPMEEVDERDKPWYLK